MRLHPAQLDSVMHTSAMRRGKLLVLAFLATPWAIHAQGSKRPMTWMDQQRTRSAAGAAVSPDGQWVLYTISTPDWKEARSQSDIYLVSATRGLSSTRQLTYTRDKNESTPQWLPSGQAFVFSSNREAPAAQSGQQQLFVMRPDGGEARRITDAREGVTTFDVTSDGRWVIYRSGKADEEQLYALAVADVDAGTSLDSLKAVALTKHPTGINLFDVNQLMVHQEHKLLQ